MLIHFIWNDENVPEAYDKFVESWKIHHPDATIRIWTFAEGENLIADHYPEILEVYQQYDLPIQKANALRYVILHLFGGIYADLDMMCLKPLTEVYESNDLFLAKHNRYYICNAIMGSIPGHVFWRRCIDGLVDALDWMEMPGLSEGQKAIHSTGSPYMEQFIKEFGQTITIYDSEYFYPVGCHDAPEFYVGEYPLAYTMHYWNYSWGRNYKGVRETIIQFA